jgi:hypothetical protein
VKNTLKAEVERIKVSKSQMVMLDVLLDLRAATPVDTGEARDGWSARIDGIENRVEHIEFLNKGTSKQAPSHFIERTVLSNKNVSPKGTIVRTIE